MPSTQPSAHRLQTLFVALMSTLPLAAGAEDVRLRAIEVSEQAYSDTTVVVTGQSLAARAALDARDVLQNEVGVSVGGGGNAIAQKIYVRGIEDMLLTLTLDGVPQGGNIYHHQGRVMIDPALLKSIELDKGGTVASVGPGGLAGSVRMTTKDARGLLRPGQTLGGMLNGGLSSNEGDRYGGAVFGELGKALDFLLYANRTNTDDYKDGRGNTQAQTASEQSSALAKFAWRVAPGHALSLSYNTIGDEGTRYLRPHMVDFVHPVASNLPMPQKLEQDTLTLGYRYEGEGALSGVDFTLFTDETENARTNAALVFRKPAGTRYGERLHAQGANLLLKSRLGDAQLRYGFNHHDRKAKAVNAVMTGEIKANIGLANTSKENARVSGLFVEGGLPLGERFLLDLGARYDWYDYTDPYGQDFSSDGLSPNAALTLQATDALSFRLGASRTERGVGLGEAFFIDNGAGVANARMYAAHTSLKPETATNVELGANYRNGPWSAKAAVFRMTIDDFIDYRATFLAANDYFRGNVGKVKSSGYELGGEYRAGNLRVGASVAHAKPELNGADLSDVNFSLGVSTGRTWLLNLGYAFPAWNLDIGWNGRHVEEHDYKNAAGTVTQTKDGYTIHDLYANWHPMGKDKLRVTLAVRNLTDKFYYDQSSYGLMSGGKVLGYAEPGRDIRLDLSWKF